jgi:hypothetical protein
MSRSITPPPITSTSRRGFNFSAPQQSSRPPREPGASMSRKSASGRLASPVLSAENAVAPGSAFRVIAACENRSSRAPARTTAVQAWQRPLPAPPLGTGVVRNRRCSGTRQRRDRRWDDARANTKAELDPAEQERPPNRPEPGLPLSREPHSHGPRRTRPVRASGDCRWSIEAEATRFGRLLGLVVAPWG